MGTDKVGYCPVKMELAGGRAGHYHFSLFLKAIILPPGQLHETLTLKLVHSRKRLETRLASNAQDYTNIIKEIHRLIFDMRIFINKYFFVIVFFLNASTYLYQDLFLIPATQE